MRTLSSLTVLTLAIVVSGHAQGFEFRLGASSLNSHRNVTQTSGSASSTESLAGLDLLLRSSNAGLMVRAYQGTFGDATGQLATGDLLYADARLLLGSRPFAVQLGYGRRAESESFGENFSQFAIGGAMTTIRIGASGLTVSLGAAAFVEIDSDKDKVVQLFGGEIESQAQYALPRGIPAYLMIGFRFNRFTLEEGGGDRHEELSGLLIGGGLRLGRR